VGVQCVWQLAGKVEPKEIQPGVGVAMVSGLLVTNDNQYTLQVIRSVISFSFTLQNFGVHFGLVSLA